MPEPHRDMETAVVDIVGRARRIMVVEMVVLVVMAETVDTQAGKAAGTLVATVVLQSII